MTYTYTFANAEETNLKREDEQGNIAFVPVSEGNRDYAEFLSAGATASPYVAPAVAPYVDPLEARIAALEASVAALQADHQTLMNNNNGGY